MQDEIRVGTIVTASAPEWSHKLLELRVDFGEFGQRTVLTGIKQWYAPESLQGKQALFLTNVEPRKMGEGLSEAMILAADRLDGSPQLFILDQALPPGNLVH